MDIKHAVVYPYFMFIHPDNLTFRYCDGLKMLAFEFFFHPFVDVLLFNSDDKNKQQWDKPKQYKEKAGYVFGFGSHKKSV